MPDSNKRIRVAVIGNADVANAKNVLIQTLTFRRPSPFSPKPAIPSPPPPPGSFTTTVEDERLGDIDFEYTNITSTPTTTYIKNKPDVVLLVVDLTRKESLEELEPWFDNLDTRGVERDKILLVCARPTIEWRDPTTPPLTYRNWCEKHFINGSYFDVCTKERSMKVSMALQPTMISMRYPQTEASTAYRPSSSAASSSIAPTPTPEETSFVENFREIFKRLLGKSLFGKQSTEVAQKVLNGEKLDEEVLRNYAKSRPSSRTAQAVGIADDLGRIMNSNNGRSPAENMFQFLMDFKKDYTNDRPKHSIRLFSGPPKAVDDLLTLADRDLRTIQQMPGVLKPYVINLLVHAAQNPDSNTARIVAALQANPASQTHAMPSVKPAAT